MAHTKIYTILGLILFVLFIGLLYLYPRSAPDTNFETFRAETFEFGYPNGMQVVVPPATTTVDWSISTMAPGEVLARINIDESLDPQTNFRDARFVVGKSVEDVPNCLAPWGSDGGGMIVEINGTPFTKFLFSDAATGNRYDTTAYRVVKDDACYTVEYTIHTTVLENYAPQSGITMYDQAKIATLLESMAQSFRFRE